MNADYYDRLGRAFLVSLPSAARIDSDGPNYLAFCLACVQFSSYK